MGANSSPFFHLNKEDMTCSEDSKKRLRVYEHVVRAPSGPIVVRPVTCTRKFGT
jgi:hypothetical protein